MTQRQRSSIENTRIEISGGIASGKTTLAMLLEENGYAVGYENFRANPFWEHFYRDPIRFAFETELTFTLQHYNQIKCSVHKNEVFVLDASLCLDHAYAVKNLEGERLDVFERMVDVLLAEVNWPTILIHLTCSADKELERIKSRARSQETSITVEYLQGLNDALAEKAKEYGERSVVLVLPSDEIDFANDSDGRRRVLKVIDDAVWNLP